MQARKKGQCSEEQIAANIAKLIDEGKSQEQSVAIAFEGCPQERSEQLAILENISKNGKRSYRRVTVVDEVQGIIRGYIAVWGSPQHRDDYQTYFDKEKPPELGLDFLPIPLIYEHGFDGGVKKEIIGRVTRAWFDDVGIAFEAKLDQTVRAFTRFIAEIRSGKLSTSSATGEHLAEFDEDGRFVNWPLLELSLTANPAEALMPAVQLMRSNLAHGASGQSQGEMTASERKQGNTRQGNNKMLEKIIAALTALGPDATTEQIIAVLLDAGLSSDDFGDIQAQMALPKEGRQEENGEETPAATGEGEGDTPATEQVVTAVEEVIAAVTVVLEEKGATEAVAELEEVQRSSNKLARENASMALQIAAHRSQKQRERAMPNVPNQPRHGGGNGRITDMREMAFDHLNARQMGYGYQIMTSLRQRITPSEGYMRAFAGKIIEEVDRGYAAFHNPENYKALRSSIRGATRADELIHTDNTGYGTEWVPGESWQAQVWEGVHQNLIMDTLMKEMLLIEASANPGSTTYVPLDGADPTFYKAPEATDVGADLESKPLVDPSRPASAQVSVTPGKGMAWTEISTEMIEDSIVAVLPQYEKQYQRKFNEQVEYLFLNGDVATSASTNINLIDGTPASGTGAPSYLITDGALTYALVDGSSTSSSGGLLTSGDFLDARGLMPNNIQTDPTKLIYISDNSLQLKALRLTDWKDISVSLNPTQESGTISTVWGSPYLASGQMAKANSAGKIPAAGGSKGRLLCISPEYWAMVWKRHITFKTEENIKSDTTLIVSTFRLAFRYRSAGASTCIYNLTV